MNKLRDKWRTFEHLVAAIQEAAHSGSTVRWNEKINGRQFDVTIRTPIGAVEELTVVECKDTKSRVPVEKVDALVTKARDAGAALAVMVSQNGYQDGCHEVAQRHGMQLLTLNEVKSIPADLLSGTFTLAANIYGVSISTQDDQSFPLTEDRGKLPWLLNQGYVIGEGQQISLRQVIHRALSDLRMTFAPKSVTVELDGSVAYLPDRSEPLELGKMKFQVRLVQAALMRGGPQLDPWLISRAYRVQNELTGESTTHQALHLKPTVGDLIKPGKFYHNSQLGISYYCRSIVDGEAKVAAVEAYQHGSLIQVEFTADAATMTGYVEVTDKSEIKRFAELLARMPSRQ